jgi:hypothetical protein
MLAHITLLHRTDINISEVIAYELVGLTHNESPQT